MNYTEKNKIIDKVSLIIIMGICVEFFLYFVDYCFTSRFDMMTKIPSILNVLALIFLVVSVFLFVKVYKDNKKDYLIYAIEFLVLAFMCPFLTYWYYPKYFGLTTFWLHSIKHKALWVVVLVYYIARAGYAVYKGIHNSQSSSFKKKKVKN